jgi:hypothetical protein
LKLDFDTRKNMSSFAYLTAKITAKINDLLSIRKIVKNCIDVALFMVRILRGLVGIIYLNCKLIERK